MAFFGHWYVIAILLVLVALIIFGPRTIPQWAAFLGQLLHGGRRHVQTLRGTAPPAEAETAPDRPPKP